MQVPCIYHPVLMWEHWFELTAMAGKTAIILQVNESSLSDRILTTLKEGFTITFIGPTNNENISFYKFDWSKPTVCGGLAEKMLEKSKEVGC